MTFSLQTLLTLALLVFIGRWRRQQAKRKRRSWDELVVTIRANGWGLDEVSQRYLNRGGIKTAHSGLWGRIEGARSLWAMFTNASLLIQLADYAAEHNAHPDWALLEGMRSDAFKIRFCALIALVKCATT
jgi:hypothetical protein